MGGTVPNQVSDPRQPAYEAVYRLIRSRDPGAAFNAFTWRCVHAALNAANVGSPVDPQTGSKVTEK